MHKDFPSRNLEHLFTLLVCQSFQLKRDYFYPNISLFMIYFNDSICFLQRICRILYPQVPFSLDDGTNLSNPIDNGNLLAAFSIILSLNLILHLPLTSNLNLCTSQPQLIGLLQSAFYSILKVLWIMVFFFVNIYHSNHMPFLMVIGQGTKMVTPLPTDT